MAVALATAWRPRGEMARFERVLPQLRETYTHLAVSLPPDASQETVAALTSLGSENAVAPVVTPEWSWGRYLALQKALESGAAHIHYVDFDRLLRWLETRPQEWRSTVETIQRADCTIVGRSKVAYNTHPRCLRETEAISNQVVSQLLGIAVDASAGSKGFSRRAAEYILANSLPGRPFGTDAEWPILAKRAGFQVVYVAVDGLDWESADRYQDQAAGLESQQRAAAAYDADPRHWAYRVAVAEEIVQVGLEAARRPLPEEKVF